MQPLITKDKIISLAFEDKNFATDYIPESVVLECQEGNLASALGAEFYAELQTQVAGKTLTEENKTVLETYLQPALAFFVKAKVIPGMAAKLVSAGVVVNIPDGYTQQANPTSVGRLMEAAQQSGNFWLRKGLEDMESKENTGGYATYNLNCKKDHAGSSTVNPFSVWRNL